MTLDQWLLLLTPIWPLLLAALTCIPGGQKHAGTAAVLASLPALWLSQLAYTHLSLPTLLLGSVWQTLPISQTFLLFTALLWLLSALYGLGYLQKDSRAVSFWRLWLLTLSGNLGLLVSADIISFYLFFALMTFAGYGLVIHNRSASALRAGRIYLIMAIMGEMLILSGLFLASAATAHTSILISDLARAIPESSHTQLILFCLFFGFGVKAGVPLLHLWLPLAHPVAPTPASAVLSGAMIKAGLFAWLGLLPLGEFQSSLWAATLIILGFTAAFGAALLGVLQNAPKAVLAYSSISQMGLMTLTLGCIFLQPSLLLPLLPVLTFFALHHALAKGALFLSTGINAQYQTIPVVLFTLGILLPALSLIGLLGSGAHAKLLLKAGLYDLPLNGLILAITLSAAATTSLMLRFLWLLKQQRQQDTAEPTNTWMQLSWAALVLCSFFAPQWFAADLFTPLYQQPLAYAELWWVPALTLLISLWLRHHAPRWQIPQGDMVVVFEQASRWLSPVLTATAVNHKAPAPTISAKVAQAWLARLETLCRSQIAALFGLLLLLANLLVWWF